MKNVNSSSDGTENIKRKKNRNSELNKIENKIYSE